MIRIFVIENDAPIIVSGLKRFFFPSRDGIDIIGFAETVEEAIEKTKPLEFDLFILDLWLDNKLPIQNFRTLKDHFPGKPVLIYTSEVASAWKQRMFQEGATGYLTKNTTRAEFKDAILKTANGERFFPATHRYLTPDLNPEVAVEEKYPLSPIHKEIIYLLSKGLSHKETATAMHLSLSGFEKTLQSLKIRYNIKNTLELVSMFNTIAKSAENP